MKNSAATWQMAPELASKLVSLERHGQRRIFRPTEQIYPQGEVSTKFFLVVSGLVQVSIIRTDGTEVLLEMMGPNTICGESAAFDRLPRYSCAYAVENSILLEYDACRLTPLLREEPEFALALLRATSLKQRALAFRLGNLSSRNPEERIFKLLNRLSEMFAVKHPNGKMLLTKLTHEQIATMTGTTRVTVTRSLGRLRKHGMLRIEKGYFVLLDEAPLSI